MTTRMRPVALSLLAVLALSACGAPRAGLVIDPAAVVPAPAAPAVVSAAQAPSVALTPTVRVDAGATPAVSAPAAAPQGSLEVLGHRALSRAELAEDAEDAGYRLQSSVSVPMVTGFVRRSAGADYLLEAKKNHLGEKTPAPTTYTMKTTDAAIRLWLGQHVNQKVDVKGLFAGTTVTVTYADKALDLGFLTNWWTKGKVRGTITGADGLPLVNVEVKARSAEGYVFLGNTDDTGAFAVKNLAPGHYQVWLSKVGFGVVSRLVEVKSHQATEVAGKLYKN